MQLEELIKKLEEIIGCTIKLSNKFKGLRITWDKWDDSIIGYNFNAFTSTGIGVLTGIIISYDGYNWKYNMSSDYCGSILTNTYIKEKLNDQK